MILKGKIIIRGVLKTRTGLHIGGSKATLKIGSVDNNVIKTASGKPYIPGSSLKGKLRSLLARTSGSWFFSKNDQERESATVQKLLESDKYKGDAELEKYGEAVAAAPTDEDQFYLLELFGFSGDNNERNRKRTGYTRLLVRDAFLANEDDPIFKEGFTDVKFENVINRITGTAENPRQQERVPVGAEFSFEVVYSVYDDAAQDSDKLKRHIERLMLALQLLEDDGLGGSISRGYGQVKVEVREVVTKLITDDMRYIEHTPFAGSDEVIELMKTEFQPQ